jgi:Flp pilus assembly protein TadD
MVLGLLARRAGKPAEAVAELDRALAGERRGGWLAAKASALVDLGDLAGAEAALSEAERLGAAFTPLAVARTRIAFAKEPTP